MYPVHDSVLGRGDARRACGMMPSADVIQQPQVSHTS